MKSLHMAGFLFYPVCIRSFHYCLSTADALYSAGSFSCSVSIVHTFSPWFVPQFNSCAATYRGRDFTKHWMLKPCPFFYFCWWFFFPVAFYVLDGWFACVFGCHCSFHVNAVCCKKECSDTHAQERERERDAYFRVENTLFKLIVI